MREEVAKPSLIANSTARRFKTGRDPGCPVHTGHVNELGSSPKAVEHPQKIFDFVRSWACTSRPMTGSYSIEVPFFFVVYRLKL
jgi:hypothetical protein